MREYQQDLARRLQEDWRMPLRMRGIHPTLPNQTFAGQLHLRVGGRELQLIDAKLGSPTGNLMVYLPDAKVIFLGDLYQNAYFPSVDSRDIHRWVDTLEQVEKLDVDIYVPGHGQPSGKKELGEYRLFLTWLKNEVEARIREGKSLDQVKHDLDSLETYHWHAPELAPNAVEAVYKQLVAAQGNAPHQGDQGGGRIKGTPPGESN
jgi:glyoxylase-like metal-dependent hydrolase (beta-lactamase superfamily II)